MSSLKDVAAEAGVSVATVSRLLNGSLKLPEKTHQRIQKAVEKLDYQPNPHARWLSRGQSDAIGLVIPDIANPFFATLVSAAEEEADRRGMALSLYVTLNREGRELTYLRHIERNHVAGLVFVTNHADEGRLAKAINGTGRVVILDEDVPSAKAPKLFCDNEMGGCLAGQHLAACGHREVLFVAGNDDMISSSRRLAGLDTALYNIFGEEFGIRRYAGDYTIEFGRQAGRMFIDEKMPETAIFAGSDEIAIGMIEVFRDNNVSIPRDVSMIGFDDVGPLHLFASPLTAIRQPVRDLGRRALELLLDTDSQDLEPPFVEELLPVEIVERESVAPPANRQR